jgi:hypothetical protein
MAKRFMIWLDSGANAFSRYNISHSLEELGYSDEEWDAFTENEKDDVMRDIAFACSDWGYTEL